MQSDPNQIADLKAMKEVLERDLLHFLFNESDAPALVIDAETMTFVAANASAQDLLSMKMRSLGRKVVSQVLPDLDPMRIDALLKGVKRRGKLRFTLRTEAKKGQNERTRVTVHFVDGKKQSFVVFLTIHTDVQEVVNDAALANERLRSAIEALSDGFVFYDKDDRMVVCNERYREIYRNSAEAMVPGATFEQILRYGLDRNQYQLGMQTSEEWLATRLAEHRKSNSFAEQRLADGRWLQIVERSTPDGGRVGLRVDITHQKEQQAELRRLTRTDDLTGLLNRAGITRKIQLLAFGLSGTTRLAIVNIDLDRFKAINDVYGPDTGDEVLLRSAEIISGFEPTPKAIGRMGADEFLVVLEGDHDDAQVLGFAERTISRLNRTHTIENQNCQVGASIGISFVDESTATEIRDHLTASDIALNVAKQNGGNKAVVFQESMRADIMSQLEMAKDIRRGIKRNEFLPFFQPQLNTSTGAVVGFEALIRWRHPDRGLVPAFQFLQVAQRVGLTEALDDLVMDKCCAAVKEMMAWGLDPVCVSINLSLAQISDPRILSRLLEHVARYEIEPDNLRIELLESTLLEDRSSLVVSNVHRLIRAGFQVELDDFGTGHAAISTLRSFEVSRIKVDRSFVSKIDEDPELQVITSALIDLANNLGIDALAEGVETAGEQSKLCELGCYVAQGFFHARPMPLDELRNWLVTRGDIRESAH